MTLPPVAPREWTYEEFAALAGPDDRNRYEILDGEIIVTPSPSTMHQLILGRLFRALDPYVEREGIGVTLPGVDLLFVSGQYLCPDLLVVPMEEKKRVTMRGIEGKPLLVIEIQSPSSGAIDRVKKPRRYRDFGVPEYWVVDPKEEAVLVWHFAAGATDAEVLEEELLWQPSPAREPLKLDVKALFKPL